MFTKPISLCVVRSNELKAWLTYALAFDRKTVLSGGSFFKIYSLPYLLFLVLHKYGVSDNYDKITGLGIHGGNLTNTNGHLE